MEKINLNQYILENVLVNYDLGSLKTFSQVGGWFHVSYAIETEKGKFFLKFFRLDHIGKNGIDFTLFVQARLLSLGFPVHETILTRKGALTLGVEVLVPTRVAVFDFLPGEQKRYGEIKKIHLQKVGEMLKSLHQSFEQFPKEELKECRPPAENFNQELTQLNAHMVRSFSANCFSLSEDRIHFLEQSWQSDCSTFLALLPMFKTEESQLIHADFTPENIIFLNNEISGILDFDKVRMGLPLEDVAITVGACLLSAVDLDVKIVIKEIVKNYGDKYSLRDQEFILNMIRLYIWKQISWAWDFQDQKSFLTFERKYKELSLLKNDDIFTN